MKTTKKKAIKVSNFCKSFDEKEIIKNLSFEVFEGETFAFLGTNGSGKTTTIRTLIGVYKPSKGTLHIGGKQYSRELGKILGYLPEERGLYINSKVLETMVYFAQLKGLSALEAEKRSLKYLDRVDLLDKKDLIIKRLSSGQQQKIQLGITIINDPKILILDEPMKGFDPVNRELFLEILFEHKKKKATIIFTTHEMDETEKIADRIMIIKNGERKLYGDLEEIKKSFKGDRIKIHFTGTLPKSTLYEAYTEKHYAELKPKKGVKSDRILSYLLDKKVHFTKFEIAGPSLNEIFLKVSENE